MGAVPCHRDQRRRARRRLGPVQLRRLRGPQGVLHGVRGRRAHDGTPRRGPGPRLWPGDVGEQRGQRQVRHDDGVDAAAALDRRVHRLDGGVVLRGVRHDAVPLLDRRRRCRSNRRTRCASCGTRTPTPRSGCARCGRSVCATRWCARRRRRHRRPPNPSSCSSRRPGPGTSTRSPTRWSSSR